MSDDYDYPSDTGDDEWSTGGPAYVGDDERNLPEVTQLKLELLQLSALTNRGQLATDFQRRQIEDCIYELEDRSPIRDSASSPAILGTWALIYSSEDVTRSSPFFWAFRQLTEKVGGDSKVADTIFSITDSIPIKTIGEAIQTITQDELKSEVEVIAGNKGPGAAVFPSFRSIMTTTSRATALGGMDTELSVEKTQVKKSDIGKLIGAINDIAFPTEDVFNRINPESTSLIMTTTFLDGQLRISRNEYGSVFCFTRVDKQDDPAL
ncbi:unnamed protein product [Chrysoparadoxa australica]